MGRWITKQNLKAEVRHECEPPRTSMNFYPKGGFGSVWECDCGKRWEVKQDVIAYYPSNPEKPVLTWGKYGEEEFGKRSALIGEEA